MKKIYIAPKLGIYHMVMEGMIAASTQLEIDQNTHVDQLSSEKNSWEQEFPWEESDFEE